jgi:hypothetical protein
MTADVKIVLDKWAKEKILDLKEFYLHALVSNYNTSPLKATGKFGQSLAYSIDDKGLIIYTTVGYLSALTEGTSPSEARAFSFDTLYRDIIDWVTAKPVKLEGGISKETFAYRATSNIMKYGTTIYQLYGRKNQDTGLISKVFSEAEINELFIELKNMIYTGIGSQLTATLNGN